MERMQVSRCKLKKTPSTSAPKKKQQQDFKTADIRVAGSRICTWRGAFPLVPGPVGFCQTCTRFAHLIACERGGNRVMNWARGISLKVNMKAKVRGHDASLLHRKYADYQETHIKSLPTILQAWKDQRQKQCFD